MTRNDRGTSDINAELQRLSGDACKVLKRICAAHADHPFQEGKEDSLRPFDMTRAEFRLALSELWREGWLVAVRKIEGSRLFFIPSGRWEAAQNHFFPIAPSALNSDGIHLSAQAGSGLTGELFRALLFTAEEGLPLTAKGAVHKKFVNLLAAMLQLNEGQLQKMGLRSPYPDDYPLPAILAIDLLLHLGLLERSQQAFSLAVPTVENWLCLDDSEMFTLLLNAVSRRYGRRTAADRHFRCLIARPEYIPGQWYSLKDTIGWMEAQGLSAPGDRASLMKASVAWLNGLAGFGWCEVGVTAGESPCFRWTSVKPPAEKPVRKDGQAAERIIVQPDLEVLVPEDTPYRLRWSLACFAELVQCDCMWSFRLTRERLERASGRGMSPQEIITWLDRCAKNGLPGEVRAVLGQWSRDIGRTSLAETLVLSCRNEQDADLIAGHPRLQGSLERLGPRHFGVNRDQANLVRKELASAGMAPLEGRPSRSDEAPSDSGLFRLSSPPSAESETQFALPSDPAAGLWYGDDYASALPPEMPPMLASPKELWPDSADVPSMWIKDRRRYHASTARLIMEQAMKWGTKVRLTMEERTCEFIPSRILPGAWKVSGYLLGQSGETSQERELSEEDWDKIQLVVPSFPAVPPSAPGGGCGMMR
ncbi:helicase-associated domain-containing protein [Paenibacillus durus]|uniref:Helicase XPB/Ssl2 N-terminal domain-containing protein n=1 Tax=Paenibacillus durus TaxID=44251 RepID=A0A089IUI9_PAEDU|nr:helicase-associated domain-containing protein [Paenibacillus durus]AIQ12654.1 hypothetical protein PDUR_12645 [Paenibacillus durus]